MRAGQWWSNLGRGLYNGLTPLLGKEMRGRTRGWRTVFLLIVYLGVLTAGAVLYLWMTLGNTTYINAQVGLSLYGFFVLGLVLLLAFITPAIAASAISGEKERRTYDLLMVTNASPGGIVLGKWLASVAYLLFLVVAALPVLAVVFLFGGVPLKNLGLTLLVALITGLGYGALGIALSAILKRTQAATITSLVVVFLLIFVTLAAAVIVSSTVRPPMPGPEPAAAPANPWYVFLSPLAALGDVLPGGNMNVGQGIPLVGSILNELLRGVMNPAMQMEYAYNQMGYSGAMFGPPGSPGGPSPPTGIAAWPSWARFTLYQALLTAACLALATLAIMPVKPWTRWRRKQKLVP